MQKAYLEGRLRQVNHIHLTLSPTNLNHTVKVCQHIKNKRSYVDFVSDHAHQRIDEHQHLNKLCKDYQLYSPNLDGLIQEILEKVELMVEIESEFLGLLSDREKAEVKMLVDQAKEIFEQLLPLRRKKSV